MDWEPPQNPGRFTDRIQRIGLALPVPVLPVRLHHPDTGCGQVPGQARAIAAGPFDTDKSDVPEPAQPAQQVSVSGRGSRELLDTQQPADRI